jgi:hypothetical protein
MKHRTELPSYLKTMGLPLIGVEIGCAEGLHAADLIRNGLEKLYMVDTWATIPGQKGDGGFDQQWHDKNFHAAIDRIRPFGEKVVVLRGMSNDMARFVTDPLGLVYLDGDHSYEGVKRDLETWYPLLVKGGLMAGHDYEATEYGVKRAVHEFANDRGIVVRAIPENEKQNAGFWFQKL